MSKKSKVSSVKKSDEKAKKALKPIKKNSANKADKNKAKKIIKPIVKKKEVKKASPKKIIKSAKAKVVIKPTPKKVVTTKKPIAKNIKVAVKKIAAKPVKKELKKPAPKVAIKKIEKVSRPIVTKKVEKTVPVITKKETVMPKPIEVTTKKAVKEVKISTDVIAINNTIPVKKENEISLSKIASIASSITNPIKKTESYSVKPEKEPNGKFELEFVIKASADLLYEFLYTQSGLSEWFCDDVNIRNGIYTFIWDGQMQQARLLKTIDHQLVRFQWVDKIDGSFFEFRLQHDDLTNDVSLMVTDFADSSNERDSSKLLWQNQVEKLMHVVGSI